MRYTVVSTPAVEAELTRIWLRALDRSAVSLAANRSDQQLRNSPYTVGTPYADYYTFLAGCLMVRYRISPDDCLVEILSYELISS